MEPRGHILPALEWLFKAVCVCRCHFIHAATLGCLCCWAANEVGICVRSLPVVDNCRELEGLPGPQVGVCVCRLHVLNGCKELPSACNAQLLEQSLVSAGSRSMDTSRGIAANSPANTFTTAATTAAQSAQAGTSEMQQPQAAHRQQADESAAALTAAEVDVIEISSGEDTQSQGSQLPGHEGLGTEAGPEVNNEFAGGHTADCTLRAVLDLQCGCKQSGGLACCSWA